MNYKIRLFFAFIILFIFINPALAGSAEQVPTYDLKVSFDVNDHSLAGKARVDLPADQGLVLSLGMVEFLSLESAGEPVDLKPDANGTLELPAAEAARQFNLSFRRRLAEGIRSSSLINNDGIVLLDKWYPLPASPVRYSLTASIPVNFSAIAPSDKIVVKETDQGREVAFSFAQPLSFLHFVAGPYVVEEEKWGDGKVLRSYFFPEDQDLADHYRQRARSYLDRYEKLLGPYPYSSFNVVENRLPTGFAMPTFTLLGQQVVRLPFITETSLGHEVLHSWFGNGVDVDSAHGNWCEGLTTCLADQAFREDKGLGSEFRKGQLVKYASHVPRDEVMIVTDFRSAGGHDAASQKGRAIGYNKVSMIFHMLRRELGDEFFYQGLKDFYQDNRYQVASWQDLEQSFVRAAGLPLTHFFGQWLERSDIIDVEVENLDLVEDKGVITLKFELVQKTEEPYQFKMPLKVMVGDAPFSTEIEVKEERTAVSLDFADYPRQLLLDADYDLMRQLTTGELPPVWSRFLGAERKIAVIADGAEEIFASMIPMLERLDCRLMTETEVAEAENLIDELQGAALLFLGVDSRFCRSVFARPDLPETGFTLDVRHNPLASSQVAVLIKAAEKEQVEAVAHKLRHYGKYGHLYFINGRNREKVVPISDMGQVYGLDRPPQGMVLAARRDFFTVMADITPNRVVYVGESHVDQADHFLQLRIIRAIHQEYPDLAIGMEMFNRKNQEALDLYVKGEIDERQFIRDSSYFANWGYDYRLYRDILIFAREQGIPLLALNLDKDIVSRTFRQGGVLALDQESRDELVKERDLGMEGYRQRLIKVFGNHSGPHFSGERMDGFVQAQALWDETMAETIADYLLANPDRKMVVLAGSGHVFKNNGIPPRVDRRLPVKQAVVLNVKGQEMDSENADFAFFSSPRQKPMSPLLGVILKARDDMDGMEITAFSRERRSGAREGGLEKGDIIVSVDGVRVKAVEDVKIALLYHNYGDTIEVRIVRPTFLLPDPELGFQVKL